MGELRDRILNAIAAGRYVFTDHADEQLRERGIEAWQAAAGAGEGRLLAERPRDKPNPVVEFRHLLPDGTPVKAVWAYVRSMDLALLVTVHYFDR